MPVPPILEDLDLIRVHGWYGKLNGAAATGHVRFRPNVLLRHPVTRAQILPVEFRAELDDDGRIWTPPSGGEGGHLGIDLPATDDPDLFPQGWTYTVTFHLGPDTVLQQPVQFELTLSHELAGGTFDLADAAPDTPPSPGQVIYVPDAVFRAWVPADGVTGQVLTKAPGGALWEDPTGGGGGGGVTPSQLAAAIGDHDTDGEAHDDLRTAIAGRAPVSHQHEVDELDVGGTASSSTFLRGDGTWAAPPGGGGVSEQDLADAIDSHDGDADAHPSIRGDVTSVASALASHHHDGDYDPDGAAAAVAAAVATQLAAHGVGVVDAETTSRPPVAVALLLPGADPELAMDGDLRVVL